MATRVYIEDTFQNWPDLTSVEQAELIAKQDADDKQEKVKAILEQIVQEGIPANLKVIVRDRVM